MAKEYAFFRLVVLVSLGASYSKLLASLTMYTVRSMTSGEYFGFFFIAPLSQRMGLYTPRGDSGA